MATDQLNIHDLLTLTNTRASDFAEAPEGLCIGHVHLRVGDLAQAEAFYHWPRSGAPAAAAPRSCPQGAIIIISG